MIETTLVNGSVTLHLTPDGKPEFTRSLSPREKAIFRKNEQQLQTMYVNTDFDTAWKDGRIIFKDHSMDRVLKVLSRYYNVRFDVKDPHVYHSVITAKFDNEQLPQILDYLRLASGIKYKINKPEIVDGERLKINTIEIMK